MDRQAIFAVATVVLLPLLSPSTSLATDILIFAIAAMACNLLLGYGGMLSFGQGIFFGAGAYTAGIVLKAFPDSLVTSLLGASAVAAVIAFLVGVVAVRRSGIYFVMLTFAFAQMAYFAAYTFSGITGGENGLVDVPRPNGAIFGYELFSLQSGQSFYVLAAGSFLLFFLVLRRVTEGAFGRTLQAIRENDARALSLGYEPRHFKIMAFVVSGFITGYAGALYAMFLRFAPLSNIELTTSEIILIMTIVGGTGSLTGAVFGAIVVLGLGELLSSWWPRWHLLLGLTVIFVSVFMRGGIYGGLLNVLHRMLPASGAAPTRRG